MAKALFINGVYEDTLDEIIESQKNDPTKYGYLQPYSSRRIKLLSKTQPPTPANPVTLYLSLTASLHCVSYSAEIVEWIDKKAIDSQTRKHPTELLKETQPLEKDGIYDQVNGKDCVNLIVIRGLKKIEPFPVGELKKTRDNTSLKVRQTSGGWSVVHEPLELPNVPCPVSN